MQTDKYLNSRELQTFVGNVSAMTIYRWEKDPTMHFPVASRRGKRKFWKQSDVNAWMEAGRDV